MSAVAGPERPRSAAAARRPPQNDGASRPRRRPRAPRVANSGAHASPVARRVAAAEGIDLSGVQGSARGGRITKADVLAAGNGAATRPGPAHRSPPVGPAAPS